MARNSDILRAFRFARGRRGVVLEYSPAVGRTQRAAVERWMRALAPEFVARLPRIKLAVALRLRTAAGGPAHAACFIPQKYLLLSDSLFSRRGELGRILYHELCHFVWPRLGSGRAVYEAAVAREWRARVRGDLGFSSSLAREALKGARKSRHSRYWKHYVCENFCDTGAWVLLARAGLRHGRHSGRHSEWTLRASARESRRRAWLASIVK